MMITGTALINELVDELNELKLSTMAATLDGLSVSQTRIPENGSTYAYCGTDRTTVSGKGQHDIKESLNSCVSEGFT